MKEHTWEVEEIDGGSIGIGEFYICKACGASGGPYYKDAPLQTPFLAGTPLALHDDCDVAAQQIAEYKSKPVASRQKRPGLVPKTHEVLQRAVEEGVRYGYRRAHKHTDNPHEEDHTCAMIEESVMSSIYEWFDLDDD